MQNQGSRVCLVADENVLTFRVVPIMDDEAFMSIDSRALIVHLYRTITEQDFKRLTWDDPTVEHNFTAFRKYMTKGKTTFIVALDDGIAACFTIYDTIPKQKCNMGIWVNYPYRGQGSVAIAKMILRFLHTNLGYLHIFGLTPWRTVANLATRAGCELVAEIENYCPGAGDGTVRVFHHEEG